MVRCNKNIKRYKPNSLGSLYVNEAIDTKDGRPIIYIGGQVEHRAHVIENKVINNKFDDFFVAKWVYEYPIGRNIQDSNARNFAKNLLAALKEAKLYDVDIISHSFGGMIASYASTDPCIHRVYAVHPPILGTPLANPGVFEEYRKKMSLYQNTLYQIMKRLINTGYGFEQDSFNGVDFSEVDLNKLLVIGGYIDTEFEKSKFYLALSEMITLYNMQKNDGIVTFDEEIFKKIGINYLKQDGCINHTQSGSEIVLSRVRKMAKKGM